MQVMPTAMQCYVPMYAPAPQLQPMFFGQPVVPMMGGAVGAHNFCVPYPLPPTYSGLAGHNPLAQFPTQPLMVLPCSTPAAMPRPPAATSLPADDSHARDAAGEASASRLPAHSRALSSCCLWVPLADAEPQHIQRSGNPRHCEKLFIGQTRHETTPAHIVTLLSKLVGITPAVLRSAGKGCFILFVNSMRECELVTSLHRRVLFDHGGMWYAQDEDALKTLSAYVATPSFHRACRRQLPVQCMVAEHQPDGQSHDASLSWKLPANAESPEASNATMTTASTPSTKSLLPTEGFNGSDTESM